MWYDSSEELYDKFYSKTPTPKIPPTASILFKVASKTLRPKPHNDNRVQIESFPAWQIFEKEERDDYFTRRSFGPKNIYKLTK